MEGSHRFTDVRQQIMTSLESVNPEVRSAAVATLSEANAGTAHDFVVFLINDESPRVREEVLEYIEQFPLKSDASLLLTRLRQKEHLFLVSSALQRGGNGPLIDG